MFHEKKRSGKKKNLREKGGAGSERKGGECHGPHEGVPSAPVWGGRGQRRTGGEGEKNEHLCTGNRGVARQERGLI